MSVLSYAAELLRRGYDLLDNLQRLEQPPGIEEAVDECLSLLQRSPEALLLMQRARDAGRPYSWARETWADPDDIAMEFAYEAWQTLEKLETCQDCGTKRSDWDTASGRSLRNPRWRFTLHDCDTCAGLAELQERVRRRLEDNRPQGASTPYVPKVVLRPAKPGDPNVDPGI